MDATDQFFANGWCRFPAETAIDRWIDATRPVALATRHDPVHAEWLRCGGTWFAGVNALGNDAAGAVAGGPPLVGSAVDFIAGKLHLREPQWDSAQVSICYPGYPRGNAGESDAAHRYRVRRDSAHVDGLHPVGKDRRRYLREWHGFILGIALEVASPDASPLVVWRGSHEIIREALSAVLAPLPVTQWTGVDLTEPYHAARRQVFETCERVEIPLGPGESCLVHRLALHGVAPWGENAQAGPNGRAIAYFRPSLDDCSEWLSRP